MPFDDHIMNFFFSRCDTHQKERTNQEPKTTTNIRKFSVRFIRTLNCVECFFFLLSSGTHDRYPFIL